MLKAVGIALGDATLGSCASSDANGDGTVTIDEARHLAKVEIPSFAGSKHYPVRVEITYADGTIEVKGMQ